MSAPVGLHHAGLPGYNPAPNVNWGNAGGGQASAATRRANGTARGGEHSHAPKLPASAPTTGGLFSFKRVAAVQCESNVTYPLKPESVEGQYFEHWAMKAIEHVGELSAKAAPSLQIMTAFAESAGVDIIEIKYHQLRFVPNPTSEMREQYDKDDDHLPDGYETYVDVRDPNKTYAVNPGGYHYLVTKSNAWDWTWQMLVRGDLGDFQLTQDGQAAQRVMTYAAHFSVVKLPKEYNGGAPYLAEKVGSKVVQVEFGELIASSFVAWPGTKVYIGDKTLVQALTKYDVWKPLSTERHEAEEAEEIELKGYGRKYNFQTIDDKLCCHFPGKKDDGEFKPLANFAIDNVMAIYQFADRERGLPWFRYKVHAVVNPDKEDVMYVTPEMDVALKRYDDVGRIEGEILIPLDEVDDKTVGSWFSKVSAYFRTEGYFKVEHLKALTNVLTPWPRITRIVTHFGRQPNSKLFVFGNCCYANGKLYSHEEAGVTVLPHMFGGKEVVIPVPLAKFPKLLLVPQDWVRYTFFVDFWTFILPGQCAPQASTLPKERWSGRPGLGNAVMGGSPHLTSRVHPRGVQVPQQHDAGQGHLRAGRHAPAVLEVLGRAGGGRHGGDGLAQVHRAEHRQDGGRDDGQLLLGLEAQGDHDGRVLLAPGCRQAPHAAEGHLAVPRRDRDQGQRRPGEEQEDQGHRAHVRQRLVARGVRQE